MTGYEVVPVGERSPVAEEAALDLHLDQLGRDIETLNRRAVLMTRPTVIHHNHTPARRTRRAEAAAAVLIAITGQALLAATISIGVNPVLAALTSATFALCGLGLIGAMWLARR